MPRRTAQARALSSLSRRAFLSSGLEQATPELVSYGDNDEDDFRKLWPQLVAAGAFRQQDRMKMLHE